MDEEKKEKLEKSKLALEEEKVLDFWQKNNIFEKSLEKESPKGEFVFYEGPPTANGKPGIHHLLPRAFKDIVPRFKTMQGYHVRRKAGWDTHGLPVELQVEKALGLKSKKEIEKYGIEEFNKKCKESVWEYVDLWQKFTNRIGYWVDLKSPYVTYETPYIESIWNILKQVEDQKLIYKDYKVLPWCPRCGTALSSHELAQGYENDKDLSVYAKFKVKGQDLPAQAGNTFILAWTTTPWTLPGNLALAVGEDIDYVEYEITDLETQKIEKIIFAGSLIQKILGHGLLDRNGLIIEDELFLGADKDKLKVKYKLIKKITGKDLIGLEYEPLYPFFAEKFKDKNPEAFAKAYKVYSADFVTTTDGTGVVHTAVMYGQDDFVLGTKIGLPKFHLVQDDGHFVDGMQTDTIDLSSRFVKDEEVAVDIIKDLAHRGLLFKKEKYEHSYPHCWRCKTPLIYYARDSWYIAMSKLRDKLVAENTDINWEPDYIKEGRFGEWLNEIKDWAISRERYWGTPLPIWTDKEGKYRVIGSVDELKKHSRKSGNKYFVMRHGQSTHNLKWGISTKESNTDTLTDLGVEQSKESAKFLKDKNIDLVVISPFKRTKETAEIVRGELGLKKEQIVIDERLHELAVYSFEGKSWQEYHETFPKTKENFYAKREGDESYADAKRRVMSVIYEYESKYDGKNILFITHGGPGWLLTAGSRGLSLDETYKMISSVNNEHLDDIKNAEVRALDFVPLPHNENFEVDLHRPFIDKFELVDERGNSLTRVKEVLDVWFDSGAMPFAQDHYPFDTKDVLFPADYISEAIDQTRGWFYTLHAIGTLIGRGKAYKNVICLGHILDSQGKKMSKSLGNIVDPWLMMDKYGVDALRFWMYSVNQPGDSKNFDEKTVDEIVKKVFNPLENIFALYELYKDDSVSASDKSQNILDRWILSRLSELVTLGTEKLDKFKIFEATRPIRDFASDFSTWYVRRSRERLKSEDKKERNEALATTKFVLLTLSKYMAPFTPFFAERIYGKLKEGNELESVHLCSWPKVGDVDKSLIDSMQKVREVVSSALELRQKANVKVRQPLGALSIPIRFEKEFLDIIADEVNVKEVKVVEGEIKLDTKITEELKNEGIKRDAIRSVQDSRKIEGLSPVKLVFGSMSTTATIGNIIESNLEEFKKITQLRDLEIKKDKKEDDKNPIEIKFVE